MTSTINALVRTRHGWVVAAATAALALTVAPTATAADPLPTATGPLEPGTYVSEALSQALTFTVGEGWSIGGEAVEAVRVDLVPEPFNYDGPEGYAMLGITRSDGVVFEGYCLPAGGDYEAFNAARTDIEPTAQALADHLAANPYLETTEPVAIEVDGHTGLQFDASATIGEDCEIPATFLWAIPLFDNWMLGDGNHARYHFVDANGEVVALVLEASSDVDLDELAALAQPVIDSLTLEPIP